MRHQEILFGITGQTFVFDVPEGRPVASPAPGAQVYLSTNSDTAGAELATTGSVSIESVNTSLSSSASVGATSISVGSASGIARGRRYLLTGTDGATEWIEVAGISGTAITTRRPLSNDHASSSTFQSTRLSIAVDSTWVADQSKLSDIFGVRWRTDLENETEWLAAYAGYRIRWAYTANGEATVGVSFADLVRYSAKNLITSLDLEDRFPGWIDRLPSDYQADQGASLVAQAFYALKFDALGDDQALRRIRDTQVLGELVVHRANVIAAENQVLAGGGSRDAVVTARELYKERYQQLLRAPKVQVDQTGGGESSRARPLPLTRR